FPDWTGHGPRIRSCPTKARAAFPKMVTGNQRPTPSREGILLTERGRNSPGRTDANPEEFCIERTYYVTHAEESPDRSGRKGFAQEIVQVTSYVPEISSTIFTLRVASSLPGIVIMLCVRLCGA